MIIPDFLKTKPLFMLMKPFAMVQYGPPRSGSTLIYNIMCELFPTKKIFKVHMKRKMCSVLVTVGTYRNPLDSIASSLLRYKIEKPSDEDIKKQIDVFNKSDLKYIPKMIEMSNILMLKYENFLNNYDYIFDHFEEFFSIKILTEKRTFLKEKLGMKSVEKKLKSMDDKFGEMDKNSQLHGNHISKFKGCSGYYKKIMTEKQISMLLDEFGETMQLLGYEI